MRNLSLIAAALWATLASADPGSSKELLAKGKASFEINCASCHGSKGLGDGVAAIALNPKPRNYVKDAFKNGDKPEDVFKTLKEGLRNTPMVSFAHLSEQERWGLAYYVLELRAAGRPAAPAKP